MRIVNTTPRVITLNYRDGTLIPIDPNGGYVIRPASDLDFLDDTTTSLLLFQQGLLVLQNDDGSAYTGAALPATPDAPGQNVPVSVNTKTGALTKPDGSTVAVSGGGGSGAGGIPALQTWYQALANRDNAPAKIVGIGDSWMEYRTVNAWGKQYTQLLMQRLRAKYPTSGIGSGGGVGYIPIQNVSIFAPYANPWATTGAPTQSFVSGGLGLRYSVFGSGQSAIITFTGTQAVIHYLKSNTSRIGYYKIDGGTAQTFETNSGAISDDGYVTTTAVASGTHTLEVGWSSGGQVYIAGAAFFDGDLAKGIHMYEGGHTAYRTTDYLSASPGGAAHIKRVASLAPACVLLALGQNDYALSSGFNSAATYKANLKSIIADLRAAGVTASFLLMTSADTTAIKAAGQTSTWAQMVQGAKEVASEDTGGPGGASGVYHLALSDPGRIPASTGTQQGVWADAGAHLGNAGHSWITDILVNPLSIA